MTPIQNVIVAILRRHLKRLDESIVIDVNRELKDYGLDSMSSVSILLDIEDELQIAIPEEYLSETTFKTANSLLQAVNQVKESM